MQVFLEHVIDKSHTTIHVLRHEYGGVISCLSNCLIISATRHFKTIVVVIPKTG